VCCLVLKDAAKEAGVFERRIGQGWQQTATFTKYASLRLLWRDRCAYSHPRYSRREELRPHSVPELRETLLARALASPVTHRNLCAVDT
jgi:hypothetical protein